MIPREEAIQKIAAAAEARDASNGIMILARTDARQAESLEEAFYRIEAFAEAGADLLFIDALETEKEMEAFCRLCPEVPKLANMLQGGKTPILTPQTLESIGFKLAAYPLALLNASIRAMEDALDGLQTGNVPDIDFEALQRTLGFPEYFADIDRFQRKTVPSQNADPVDSIHEADSVLQPDGVKDAGPGSELRSEEVVLFDVVNESESGEAWFPTVIRISVKNRYTMKQKMEFKFPIGFAADLSKFVPSLSGVDLREFISRERFPDGKPVFYFTDQDDLTEVFLD